MRLNTHLSFNGQCREAFTLYAACLGAELTTMLTYGDSPTAATAPQMSDRILHATLVLGQQRLTGVDVPPGQYERPQGFSVQVNLDDTAQAERIFATLAEKGAVQLPLQETFWAKRYGLLSDRFGTPWEINCGDLT